MREKKVLNVAIISMNSNFKIDIRHHRNYSRMFKNKGNDLKKIIEYNVRSLKYTNSMENNKYFQLMECRELNIPYPD